MRLLKATALSKDSDAARAAARATSESLREIVC
jgi:hypothetical protein